MSSCCAQRRLASRNKHFSSKSRTQLVQFSFIMLAFVWYLALDLTGGPEQIRITLPLEESVQRSVQRDASPAMAVPETSLAKSAGYPFLKASGQTQAPATGKAYQSGSESAMEATTTTTDRQTRHPASTYMEADRQALSSPGSTDEPFAAVPHWRDDLVREGDSLSSIFQRNDISLASLHDLINLNEETERLALLMPGESVSFATDEQGVLISLLYEKTPLQQLYVTRVGEHMTARTIQREPEKIRRHIRGSIDSEASSLYLAGRRAGLSDKLIMELAALFQWDISFALELRPGDQFEILYEELWSKGERIGDGDLLAGRFVNSSQEYLALRYTDSNGKTGYFTPDGRSVSKQFLRDPVHFSRVSSRFNLKRLHPIHKRVMPHRGIDYAADHGTPVKASGDGIVSTADRNNASGNHVTLQHGNQYTTRYLHLSRFAKGIRPGKRVSQGQVIGYVGATGWATGPHLHYEFLINGIHRDPRTVNLPQAEPIEQDETTRFKESTTAFLHRLRQPLLVGSQTLTGGD